MPESVIAHRKQIGSNPVAADAVFGAILQRSVEHVEIVGIKRTHPPLAKPAGKGAKPAAGNGAVADLLPPGDAHESEP